MDEKIKNNAPEFSCLNDLPYEHAALHPRSKQLVELLSNKLKHHFLVPPEQRQALRIGLFGGYGQGKSSIVEAVAQQLTQAVPEIKIVRFDISHYLPDDLEYGVDILLARKFTKKFILYIALALVVCFLTVFLLGLAITDRSSIYLVIIIVSLFGLQDVLKPFLGEMRRSFFLGDINWRLVKEIFSFRFFKNPDLIIIDDLDRASVEQQKSLLRAIYKLSDNKAFSVLICMDELSLLQSPPEPEDPAELLRKVIHLELRLPQRDQADYVLMVLEVAHQCWINMGDFCEGSLNENIEHSVKWRLDFISALVRIISILPLPSHRHIKRLFNDTMTRAKQLGLKSAKDYIALLRLNGLYELEPRLRKQELLVIDLLESNCCQKLDEYLDENNQNELKGRSRLAKEFFRATRHLQPSSSWRTLVTSHSGAIDDEPAEMPLIKLRYSFLVGAECGKCQTLYYDQLLDYYQLVRRLINTIAYGYGDQNITSILAFFGKYPDMSEDVKSHSWLVVEAVLSKMKEPVARLRVYRYIDKELRKQEQVLFSSPEKLHPYLYHLWFSDEEVIEIMSSGERSQIVQQAYNEFPGFFYDFMSVLPRDLVTWGQVVNAILRQETRSNRDISRTRRWLVDVDRSSKQNKNFYQTLSTKNLNPAVLADCWPPLSSDKEKQALIDELKSHFQLIYSCYKTYGDEILFPFSIKQGFWRQGGYKRLLGENSAAEAVLQLFYLLVNNAEGWLFKPWLDFISGFEDDSTLFLEALSNKNKMEENSIECDVLLCLSVLSAYPTVIIQPFYDVTLLEKFISEIDSRDIIKSFWQNLSYDQLLAILDRNAYTTVNDVDWFAWLTLVLVPEVRPNDFAKCKDALGLSPLV